jgi:putative membrane protein
VTTGFPYGAFEYGIDLGPMLFGLVPVGLPVFFFPLVLNAYLLVLLLLGEWAASTPVRLLSVIGTVLAIDLVLDPGAVALGFWTYDGGGAFYGVPWSNYAGWMLSASVAVLAFDLSFDRDTLARRLDVTEFMLDDLVSFVVLWGSINAYFGNWIPVLVAAALGAGLLYTDRFDFTVHGTVPGIGGSR